MIATPHFTVAVSCLLVTAVWFNSPARAADSLDSECQSEATLYEIPQEQRADYVAGCIASRGGYAVMEAPEEPAPGEYTEGAELPTGEPAAEDYPQ
jgi:hypothetical protein